LVRNHFIRYEIGWSAPALRRWVRRVGLDNVPTLCTLARADIFGKGNARVELEPAIINDLEARVASMQLTEVIPTSTKVLAINGHDVMTRLGISPGPAVGKVLAELNIPVPRSSERTLEDRIAAEAREEIEELESRRAELQRDRQRLAQEREQLRVRAQVPQTFKFGLSAQRPQKP
jgi:tRNA nucleotidyltransferase (CCA-adding enzyme)